MWKRILACPICKRLSLDRGLCSLCAEKLYQRREPIWRESSGYGIASLFSWERDGWLGLRWWAASLKRQELPAYWLEPALWALDTFARPQKAPLLVPIPSLSRLNHARGFARALAWYSGWSWLELLQHPSSSRLGAQKKLDRQGRKGRRFQLRQPWPCNNSTPVILVDDIVTTGATLDAAYRALGRPKDCQAWCLMDRRLSLAGA